MAGFFGYVNERYLGLTRTIGLMVLSLVFSLALPGLGRSGLFPPDDQVGRLNF